MKFVWIVKCNRGDSDIFKNHEVSDLYEAAGFFGLNKEIIDYWADGALTDEDD